MRFPEPACLAGTTGTWSVVLGRKILEPMSRTGKRLAAFVLQALPVWGR